MCQTDTSNNDEIKPNGRLLNLMCRLLRQHEAAHQADARDDNFTLTLKAGTKLEMALEEGLQNYIVTGNAAREGENFQGHPLGKKPDALLRSVIFRLAQAYTGNVKEVEDAAKNGQAHELVQNALQVLKQWGAIAQDMDVIVRATICFKVKLTEGAEDQVRWIWAVNHHPDLKSALTVLRTNGALKAAHVLLGHDHGQRSKVAKQIEELAFRKKNTSKRQPPRSRRRSSPPRWDSHEFVQASEDEPRHRLTHGWVVAYLVFSGGRWRYTLCSALGATRISGLGRDGGGGDAWGLCP
ncbi:unnamed protein product [Prorocentrum cordatum]|uniref:Uncharacterized protein n=1 Tax=Prorocentrum cordatum TaxID=2364126 RepID=A0ABN9V1Z2_9DINO|nr:unnamed protein product [Polarella glacialis]